MSITTKLAALALVGLVAFAGLTGGLTGLTGTASAQEASGTTYASVTELQNESTSGAVAGVTVSTTGIVEWRDMPNGAETVEVELLAKHDGEYQTVATKAYDVDGEQSGEYSYDRVSGDIVAETDYSAGDFSADSDGEKRTEYVPVKVKVTVTGPDGVTCEFTESHKVVTEVTNLVDPSVGADVGVGGSIAMNDSECVECSTHPVDTDTETETATKDKHHDHKNEGHHTDTNDVQDSEYGMTATPYLG